MATTNDVVEEISRPVRRAETTSMIVGKVGWIVVQAFLWLFSLSVIFPMIWTLITSFKTSAELFGAPWNPPKAMQWNNYARAWAKMHVGTYLFNSVIVTVGTLAISITVGSLAGYGLARYSGLLGVVILVTALAFRALPSMALVLPFYYLGQLSGLYDTHILLILVLVATNQPFTIWMLRSFFMEIPREIEEAAMIDGAGRLEAFVRVIIPIMWPGIITTALFTLLLAYNNFLLPKILTQTNWTLPVGIAQFTGGEDPGYITLAAAGSVSITLPIIIVVVLFQRHLIKGLAFGAVKG